MWAAVGGWKDIMTLLECYQQQEEETLRSDVEYPKPLPVASVQWSCEPEELTQKLTQGRK